jgi:hypothetical protein
MKNKLGLRIGNRKICESQLRESFPVHGIGAHDVRGTSVLRRPERSGDLTPTSRKRESMITDALLAKIVFVRQMHCLPICERPKISFKEGDSCEE